MSDLAHSRHRKGSRPHTKSRGGCKICKSRKVKCDEARPVCGNCFRRFPDPEKECEYEPSASPSQSSSSSNPAIVNLPVYPSRSGLNSVSRSTEMRLFHHFVNVSCQDLPLCNLSYGSHWWSVTVPSIAFEVQYVYNAILGISALHLLDLNPNGPDALCFRAAAYQYMDETVAQHREEISNLNSGNAEALVTASVLLTLQSMLRLKCFGSNPPIYEPPVTTFRLQKGVRILTEASNPLLTNSAVLGYLRLSPPSGLLTFTSTSAPYFSLPDDSRLHLTLTTPDIPQELCNLYERNLACLKPIMEAVTHREERHWIQRRLYFAPTEVLHELIPLIEQNDPFALAILARYYALMKFVDESWWLKGTPEYEVNGLAGLLDERSGWLMQWPMEVLRMGEMAKKAPERS